MQHTLLIPLVCQALVLGLLDLLLDAVFLLLDVRGALLVAALGFDLAPLYLDIDLDGTSHDNFLDVVLLLILDLVMVVVEHTLDLLLDVVEILTDQVTKMLEAALDLDTDFIGLVPDLATNLADLILEFLPNVLDGTFETLDLPLELLLHAVETDVDLVSGLSEKLDGDNGDGDDSSDDINNNLLGGVDNKVVGLGDEAQVGELHDRETGISELVLEVVDFILDPVATDIFGVTLVQALSTDEDVKSLVNDEGSLHDTLLTLITGDGKSVPHDALGPLPALESLLVKLVSLRLAHAVLVLRGEFDVDLDLSLNFEINPTTRGGSEDGESHEGGGSENMRETHFRKRCL